MRSFTGTLVGAEKELFVSTGGFTSDAEMAAKSSSQRVTLVDRDGFIELLIHHYEDLESEYKAKVPLKRVYIPAQDPPIEG